MSTAIPDAAGRVILAASLVPFLYFAGRDFRLHLTARKVSIAENLLHLALGVLLAAVIARAFLFRGREAAFAILLFALAITSWTPAGGRCRSASTTRSCVRGIPGRSSPCSGDPHAGVFVSVTFGLNLYGP